MTHLQQARGKAAQPLGGGSPPQDRLGGSHNKVKPVYRPAGRCSSISCRRVGNRSITAINSRPDRTAGRRALTSPSLSMMAVMKARGRSTCRNVLRSCGWASKITTASRSMNSAARSRKASSWRLNCGSSGVSAITTMMRRSQMKSRTSTSRASRNSKVVSGSSASSCASVTVSACAAKAVSWAAAPVSVTSVAPRANGKTSEKTIVKSGFIRPPACCAYRRKSKENTIGHAFLPLPDVRKDLP